jgi:tetratricopeptide (TPR) repeat protein
MHNTHHTARSISSPSRSKLAALARLLTLSVIACCFVHGNEPPVSDEFQRIQILAEQAMEGQSTQVDHDFNAPEDKISLKGELTIESERTVFDDDARLRMRLENALETRNEQELTRFLDMEIGSDYKRRVLLALGEFYEQQGSPSRLIALYEKFIAEFPRDRETSKIFLRLGRMYRDAGASRTALTKFYNVLNAALSVPVDELKDYQEVSHRAQLEIAETFFAMGSYDEASKFFRRLLRVDLVDEDKENIMFKYAYTIYLAGDYQESIMSMRLFLRTFPGSELAAETRFLLSETFLHLNDPKSAMRETLDLMNSQASKAEDSPASWLYWKKRTGNRLANQFYQEGNFMDALTIYNAMSSITDDPNWRWPVLYQIGLCYERLDMRPKAIETYKTISTQQESLDAIDRKDPTLMSILEMALWRIDRLEADTAMQEELQKMLDRPTKTANTN